MKLIDVFTHEEKKEYPRLMALLNEAQSKRTVNYFSDEIDKLLDKAANRYYSPKDK